MPIRRFAPLAALLLCLTGTARADASDGTDTAFAAPRAAAHAAQRDRPGCAIDHAQGSLCGGGIDPGRRE